MELNEVKNTQIEQEVPFPPIYKMPLIGERAAPFRAETTKGPINFPFDYAGKWVVFFSHPGDFEPICTTEFMYLQTMQQEFKNMNTELLGLSVDSIASHLAWIQSIYQIKWNNMENISINFPIVADPTMEISNRYGMVHRGETETQTVRALFVIDPDSRIRNIMYYSNRTGRNLEEVKRIVEALQVITKENVATPANWDPGEPVIVPSPKTTAQLLERQRIAVEEPSINCVAWYLCFREQTQEILRRLGIMKKKPIIPPPMIKKPN
jgi:peroxiredoxin (alkyl hydroperoxide reductase subunit C)